MGSERLAAVAVSILLHLLLLGLLTFSMWHRPTPPAAAPLKPVIQATAVKESVVMEPVRRRQAEEEARRKAAEEDRRRVAEERRRAEAERKAADEQRRKAEAEKQRLAELKRKEQEKAKAVEAERQRQLEAEKTRKAAQEKQRKLEEERKKAEEKLEEERRRKEAEDRLKAAIAAEEERLTREAAQARQQRLTLQGRQYISDISSKVGRNWLRPTGSRGTLCTVIINQIPGGEVVGVRVTDCDGDIAFQRSVEAAVRKASPLPMPADPQLFEREIEFVFRP